MFSIPWLLFLQSLVMAQQDTKSIEAGVFRKARLVQEGDIVEFVCPVQRAWFFCVWSSPVSEKHCAINVDQKIDSACENTRLEIRGNQTSCTVQVQVGWLDHGVWTCLITYDKDYTTQKLFVDLEVGLTPSVQLNQIRDDSTLTTPSNTSRTPSTTATTPSNTSTTSALGSGSAMAVATENIIVGSIGDEVILECSAHRAHPRPMFFWELSSRGKVHQLNSNQEKLDMTETHYWVNITHTVRLFLTADLNSSVLTCTVRQEWKDTGEILYEISLSKSVLLLEPPVLPVKRVEGQNGLIPTLFFAVLTTGAILCIFALPLCLKNRRNENESQDISPLPSIENLQAIDNIIDQSSTQENDSIATRYVDTCTLQDEVIQVDVLESVSSDPSVILASDGSVSEENDCQSQQNEHSQKKSSECPKVCCLECPRDARDAGTKQSLRETVAENPQINQQENPQKIFLENSQNPVAEVSRDFQVPNQTVPNKLPKDIPSQTFQNLELPIDGVLSRKCPQKRSSVFYCHQGCFRQDSPCEHSLDSLHQLQFKDDLIKDDASKDDVIKDDENKDDLKHSDKVHEAPLHAGHEGPYKSVLV